MATLKFTYYFKLKEKHFITNYNGISVISDMFISHDL